MVQQEVARAGAEAGATDGPEKRTRAVRQGVAA